MKRMVGFGDFMLRLNPPGYRKFSQAETFERYFTGAEANVCASLAVMGVETDFVTKLPENEIADCGIAELRKLGVGTGHIARGGERMGVFYVEKGASQRPGKVVYDRKFTAVATSGPGDYNWDAIFADAGYFHFTGITPALGGALPEVVAAACRAAKKRGLFISCDLNYRKKMWTPEAAGKVMSELLPYVDCLIANEEDAEKVLGIRAAASDVERGRLSRDGYRDVARQLTGRFPNLAMVAITLRESVSASDNDWSAMLYTGGEAFFSHTYHMHIVDRVGGGDSFAAGLLYAVGHNMPPREAIEFAAAASCLKHSIELDVNLSTVADVRGLLENGGSGRVQR